LSGLRIALDGPAASGKTTVARRLAIALGYALIDTGAMYRAVAMQALRQGVAVSNAAALEVLAVDTARGFQFLPDLDGTQGYRLHVHGEDVTARLHEPAVNRIVPEVAAVSGVRRVLASEQRRLGLLGGVVMTGRDIGTVVLPEAEVKIFLTASAEERARRRVQDLGGRVSMEDTLETLRERDAIDESRADSPLAQATDAVRLDTTQLSLDEVVERILSLVRDRIPAA
jgi:cytidylate kinase